jgi:hypothetical protein
MLHRGMVMQADFDGKLEDLSLWSLIQQSKTCWKYACPMRFSCGCNTGLRMEKGQRLMLDKIR